MKLEGRVALVTGSGRNLGRAIAIAFAREGASVMVNGLRDQEKVQEVVDVIRSEGGSALPFLADVSDPVQVDRMMDAASNEFGSVDILVHNAGIRPGESMLETTLEDWRKVMAVNLDAAFILAQRAIPGMIEKGQGSIIAMSGLAAFGVRRRGSVSVAAAKSGLIGLMRAVARQYGPDGIRANTIVVGSMATDRYDQKAYLDGTPAEYIGPSHEEGMDNIPLARRGTPEEAAATCVFLAAADSGYITGQSIHMGGGLYMA